MAMMAKTMGRFDLNLSRSTVCRQDFCNSRSLIICSLLSFSRSCCICCCISRKVLSVVSMLLHLFELFLDSDKTDGDIPGRNSHDLADFLITEVFQPKKDDGAVERTQLADAFPQQAELAGVLGLLVEQVDVYRQGFGPQAAPLFPVLGDTSVEGDFPNPGIQRAFPSEGSGAPPKVDQDFLEEVGHLVLVISA